MLGQAVLFAQRAFRGQLDGTFDWYAGSPEGRLYVEVEAERADVDDWGDPTEDGPLERTALLRAWGWTLRIRSIPASENSERRRLRSLVIRHGDAVRTDAAYGSLVLQFRARSRSQK